MRNTILLLLLAVLAGCGGGSTATNKDVETRDKVSGSVSEEEEEEWVTGNCETDPYGMTIATRYTPPKGFERVKADEWGEWLRNLPLKPADHICRDYTGRPIHGEPCSAVLDIDLIGEDLQQCADACMRLRCEYLYGRGTEGQHKIWFHFVNGLAFDWWRFQNPHFWYDKKFKNWHCPDGKQRKEYPMGFCADCGYSVVGDTSYANFRKYMGILFMYANTASLEKDTDPVEFEDLRIGDIVIMGGFPGHCAIIVDMAKDGKGHTAVMFAQSFMPAQEIEIVKESELYEWYILDRETTTFNIYLNFGLNNFRRFRDWSIGYRESLEEAVILERKHRFKELAK